MNETTRGFCADPAFAVPDPAEQERMVEAILFASREPLTGREIAERLPVGSDVGEALAALRARYAGRGVHLVRIGEGWAFRTAATGHPTIRGATERAASVLGIEMIGIRAAAVVLRVGFPIGFVARPWVPGHPPTLQSTIP